MAVGAEHSGVLQAEIIAFTVDVVKLEAKRSSPPCRRTAAFVTKPIFAQQSNSDILSICGKKQEVIESLIHHLISDKPVISSFFGFLPSPGW